MFKEFCDKCGTEIKPGTRIHVTIYKGADNRQGFIADRALCSDCGAPYLEKP